MFILLAVFTYQKFTEAKTGGGILNLPELPDGFSCYGFDISHHQGDIDWNTTFKATDSLLSFVYCKATEGLNHVDSQWKNNREELNSHRTRNGAYHFFLPKKDPLLQAKHFLKNYSAQEGDLPPVLDVEVEGKSNAQLIENMKIWLKKVEEVTGMRPVIYTSHHFYRTKFTAQFNNHKFWIANYNRNVSNLEDEQIIHWQFSDEGTVPGIEGFVDFNFSKIEFD